MDMGVKTVCQKLIDIKGAKMDMGEDPKKTIISSFLIIAFIIVAFLSPLRFIINFSLMWTWCIICVFGALLNKKSRSPLAAATAIKLLVLMD
jgi:hypothetical protein